MTIVRETYNYIDDSNFYVPFQVILLLLFWRSKSKNFQMDLLLAEAVLPKIQCL